MSDESAGDERKVSYDNEITINNFVGLGPVSKTEPTSVDTVGLVTSGFVESQAYFKAKKQHDGKTVSVLHLQGMPGSGKSEIVKKLGADYSEGLETPFAKWHIECSDSNHDIKEQLKKLMESMEKNALLRAVDQGVMETAIETMMDNSSQQYVSLLEGCKFPILIIIEDPNEEDQKFLENFLMRIISVKSRTMKMHVYVTSQSTSISKSIKSNCFALQKVEGLETDEGLKLLGLQEDVTLGEREAATQIIHRLSGSPLGLLAVKATQPESYQEYLQNIENESLEQAVFEIETEKIKMINPKLRHLYEAILFLLKPNTDEKKAQRRWKAICSLSMFHHGYIPQILVRRVMHYLREEEVVDIDKCSFFNKEESKDFIENCINYGVCKQQTEEGIFSFHEVVFRALRVGQTTEHSSSLSVAIKALASVVHKDLRKPEDLKFMISMCPHMNSVLKRPMIKDDILLRFCRGRLFEVMGIALESQQQPDEEVSEAENNLIRALKIILGEIRCENSLDLSLESIIEPTTDGSVDEKAKLMVEQLAEAGTKIFADRLDIEEYISIVLHPKSSDIEYFSKDSNKDVANYFKKALEKQTPLHPEKLRLFRTSTNFFLPRDKLCATYLAERVTSILHALSRLLIFYKGQVTSGQRKRFQWFSTLCLAICNAVYQKFGIAPIFLRINAIASVGIRLKGIKHFTESERRAILVKTKSFVENTLLTRASREAVFYEHGIFKPVDTETHDALTHKRSIVRINTKLMSLGPGDDFDTNAADEVCQDLYEHAKANMVWGVSPKCLIYCGKYWAAKGDYSKAAQLSEEVLHSETVNSSAHSSMLFPWVCYNYARAVLRGKFSDRAERSKANCLEALKHSGNMEKDLVEKLEDSIKQLDSLFSRQPL